MVRLGKAMSVTRAGWLSTSGSQNANAFSRSSFLPFAPGAAAALSFSPRGHQAKSRTPGILIDFLSTSSMEGAE